MNLRCDEIFNDRHIANLLLNKSVIFDEVAVFSGLIFMGSPLTMHWTIGPLSEYWGAGCSIRQSSKLFSAPIPSNNPCA